MMQPVMAEPMKCPSFTIVNNKLYHHTPPVICDEDENPSKLCVERKRIFHENHEATTAGHLGIRKISARISQH